MSSDSLAEDEERPAPPPRRLPAWKPPPNHGKHVCPAAPPRTHMPSRLAPPRLAFSPPPQSNILTDEALVMRTNAARNAQRSM
jgi:hypothetical protein